MVLYIMKIILEDVKNEEPEITIKGDISDSKIQHILTLLKSSSVSTRIIVFDDGKEVLMGIADISHFTVSERRVLAVCGEHKYVCKYTLAEILSMFKNQGVCQISKGILVNVHHVKSLEAEFSGNYVVMLKSGERLLASRFYMKDFRNSIMES